MMPLAARLLPFPRTCKLAGPRGGMVLLLVVALDAAVFCCLFSSSLITKEFGFERAKWWLSIRGYPSLDERDTSYDVRETMTVCCGHVCLAILSNRFVRGKTPGHGTGFDIDEADLSEMWQCQGAVVASAIFACYETEDAIKYSSSIEGSKRAGLWRVVVVCNLPYSDARRNGKVPKLLLHILFPNVQFSILVDGKLKLVRDPYQLFERFLWRKNATFAISRHYRRLHVFEEAEAKKLGGKYDNASIDYQIEFYRREGLTHYSSAKLPIRSDVSEGCVIREHIAITNLFTCLWFNEVDRFTSRDQLSFSTVRDKIRSRVNWTVDMFLECERRDFVVQPPAVHDQLREMFPNNAANEPEKYSALKKLHSDSCQASKG